MVPKIKVVLGVSGGIAAYKGAELVRGLMELGLCVQVVMTRNAEKFVTPLTFTASSRLAGLLSCAASPETGFFPKKTEKALD